MTIGGRSESLERQGWNFVLKCYTYFKIYRKNFLQQHLTIKINNYRDIDEVLYIVKLVLLAMTPCCLVQIYHQCGRTCYPSRHHSRTFFCFQDGGTKFLRNLFIFLTRCMVWRHRTLSCCRFVFVTGAKAHNSSFITYRTAVSRTKTSNIFSRYKYDIILSERRLKTYFF